ncbi:MAG: hypothetical protein M3Y22_11815, partial [Pseudomonadota bacterium]|nr:hypothetical protein [Pseudomonadota bacterium]
MPGTPNHRRRQPTTSTGDPSAAIQRIATSFRRPAAQLAASLGEIGNLFAPLGIAPDDRDARIPRMLTRLLEAEVDMSHWLDAYPGNDVSGLGRAILVAMRRTAKSGQAVLEKVRLAAVDPIGLLKRWITDSDGVVATATRCIWLLDGWERISLLWLLAGTTATRRAALLEMAPMLPVLPREVMEWTDMPVPAAAMEQPCRVTSSDDTWR